MGWKDTLDSKSGEVEEVDGPIASQQLVIGPLPD